MKIKIRQLKNFVRSYLNETASDTNSGGDCYEAAGMYIMDECMMIGNDDCGLVLVHGEVSGQGALEGVRYGHAWIEDGETVIDKSNGRDIRMPKMVYYMLGKIGEPDMENWGKSANFMDVSNTNLHKYEWKSVRKKILEYQHWGPWELKTSSGL
jgi:hypothetical protein